MEKNKIEDLDWDQFLEKAKVVEVPTSDLRPSEINPRAIKDDQFRKLMQDILRDPDFMYQRPILVNRIDGENIIYAGHQRWKACIDLGWETVPVTIDEDLDEKTMKARMIMDNVHYGVWDEERFPEFKDTDLTALDIVEDKNDYTLDMDGYDGDMDKPLKNPENDRGEKESGLDVGKHTFSLIFSDEAEREEFQELANNLRGEERFEDWIIHQIKNMYEAD